MGFRELHSVFTIICSLPQPDCTYSMALTVEVYAAEGYEISPTVASLMLNTTHCVLVTAHRC